VDAMEYLILRCTVCDYLFVEPSGATDMHRCPRCGRLASVLAVFKPSLRLRLLGLLSRLPLVGWLFMKPLLNRALYEVMERWRRLRA